MDHRGGHMGMKFEYFQLQTWMSQTFRAKKVDEQKWGLPKKTGKGYILEVDVKYPEENVPFLSYCL